MALTNDQITAQNFKDFYDQIYPYLGQGGGGTGGGHTIQDDGTDMTARDNLNFVGMEVDDNSADGSTDVAEHRLTSAEISEMMGGIPNPTPRYPILFDERGTEYKVGWYILSNGTKKPVYRKDTLIPSDVTINKTAWTSICPFSFQNIEPREFEMSVRDKTVANRYSNMILLSADLTNNRIMAELLLPSNGTYTIASGNIVTLYYTKTTDTPV